MADGGGGLEDFKVVAAFVSLVTKEVDLAELAIGDMLQAERLVAPCREGVERDLAADGVLLGCQGRRACCASLKNAPCQADMGENESYVDMKKV